MLKKASFLLKVSPDIIYLFFYFFKGFANAKVLSIGVLGMLVQGCLVLFHLSTKFEAHVSFRALLLFIFLVLSKGPLFYSSLCPRGENISVVPSLVISLPASLQSKQAMFAPIASPVENFLSVCRCLAATLWASMHKIWSLEATLLHTGLKASS